MRYTLILLTFSLISGPVLAKSTKKEKGSESGSCKDITCSNHGKCVVKGGEPVCACFEGYAPDSTAGLSCLPLASSGASAAASGTSEVEEEVEEEEPSKPQPSMACSLSGLGELESSEFTFCNSLGGSDAKLLVLGLVPASACGEESIMDEIEPLGKKTRKLDGYAVGAIVTGALALGGWVTVASLGSATQEKRADFDRCMESGCDELDELADEGDRFRNTNNYAIIPLTAVLSAASLALGLTAALLPKNKRKDKARASTKSFVIGMGPADDGSGFTLSLSGLF